ncbi:MAG TPA: ABC transporter substrate-binding protein [Stellaceae bacterium]|nr:ABC transporter substrate-binding protein [Stellaceae bacterium]
MRVARFAIASAVAAALLPLAAAAAGAQTKITVGRVIGGTGLHFPTYVAMDRGFFKKEGLDATWVTLNGKAMVTAGLAGEIDFDPITTGGALAALHGAQLLYVINLSRSSQWVIVTDKNITKPQDLRGKTMAYGQPGGADYDEGATVLSRFFHMNAGKDYKVISFQGEPDEVAALINDSVQGALLQVPAAVKAEKAGFKVLLATSGYLPRLGGTTWALTSYVEKHPDTVKAFDRAIAEAIMYIRTNKEGTMPIFKTYLGIDDPQEQALLWDSLHDTYDAEIPKKLFRDIFVSRRLDMIAAHQWPKDKPLPDTEKFVARKLLDEALSEAHYVPPPAAKTKN